NKEVYLGNPMDNDGIEPIAGRGAEYCWTPSANQGTITEFANENDNTGANDTYFLPTGNFESFEHLEELLGCPLNGDWIITVTDLWEQDNGWIFSWSMDINPDLYPDLETFQTEIVDFSWQPHPDFIINTNEQVIAQPDQAGAVDYLLSATDNFGCTHDTIFAIEILAAGDVACLDCDKHLLQETETTICRGDNLQLGALVDPYVIGVKTFESQPEKTFSFSTNPPFNPYENPIQVSNIPEGRIREDGSNLVSVCLNLKSEFNSDLSITLISPNGVFLNLSSENGGRGKGYLNTCFTASAERSIITQETTTFSGNYRPQEPFSNLKNTFTNGMWTLQLSDDAGTKIEDVNILESWSMTFLSPDGGTFTWTPTDDLSCIDCLNPIVQPTNNTQYILEKMLDGCQVFDTLNVNVLGNDLGLTLRPYSLPDGQLLVNWQAVPNISHYEVSTDNLNWMRSNGDFFHIFEGLTQNEVLPVFVRGIHENLGCQTAVTLENLTYKFCDVSVDLVDSKLTTNCVDTNDAYVVVLATGGDQNYTYSLNSQFRQRGNRFNQLEKGDYDLLVEDGQGCADTLTFTVQEPEPIQLTFDKEELNCFGDTNGVAKVHFSGGAGNYEILQWSHTGSTADSIANLSAGTYFVTVQDGNRCRVTDTLLLSEPAALAAIASAKPVSCFGDSDGAATVKVTQGTPPYNFSWDNNQTGSSATNLAIGDYTVTVVDAKNCQAIETIRVPQPEPLAISFVQSPISCAGKADAALLAEVMGGVAPYKYRWSTDQTNSFAFGLESGNYSVTVIDQNGCETERTTNIQPTLAISNQLVQTDTACYKTNSNTVTITSNGGTGSNYTYEWSNGESNRTLTSLTVGNYKVTTTDELGCTQTDSIQVVELDSITFSIIEAKPVCTDSEDGQLAVSPITGGNGQGLMSNYQINWSPAPTINQPFINNLAGNATYQVTVTDQQGCQQQLSKNLVAPAPIFLELQKVDISCFGANDGQVRIGAFVGTAPIVQYQWSENVVTGDSLVENLSSDTYALTVTDQDGCTASATTSVLEPNSLEITQSQLVPNRCATDNEGQIILQVNGGIGAYQFNWSNGATTQNLQNLAGGDYEITISDENDCTLTQSFELESPDALNGTIETHPISCAGDSDGRIDITPSGGLPPYQFSIDGQNYNGIQHLIGLSTGNYTVLIKDQNDCIWRSNSISLANQEPFSVEIKAASNTINLGDSLALTAKFDHNKGNIQWDWQADAPNTFDCPINLCSHINVYPGATTTYEIYAVDENGCEASDAFVVTVAKSQQIFVPTGFTPNGDGTNDFLVVHGPEGTTINTFRLFDRWGETVFEGYEMTMNNIKNTWDGTFKGQPLNGGVFVWTLEVTFLDGTTELYKGHTTLIR
ncbi:MAG: gliding motility-associated C-terminal domain-containing protein, partial [Bacteroidota bacterium]